MGQNQVVIDAYVPNLNHGQLMRLTVARKRKLPRVGEWIDAVVTDNAQESLLNTSLHCLVASIEGHIFVLEEG